MIALLTDEDFNGRIIRGLLRRLPDVDLLTVDGVGLTGAADADVIAWAAENGRVLVTHDVNTMIVAALDRVRAGVAMNGVVAAPQRLGVGVVITDLTLIATCATNDDLAGQVWYLPL